jgi:hypothetical protein
MLFDWMHARAKAGGHASAELAASADPLLLQVRARGLQQQAEPAAACRALGGSLLLGVQHRSGWRSASAAPGSPCGAGCCTRWPGPGLPACLPCLPLPPTRWQVAEVLLAYTQALLQSMRLDDIDALLPGGSSWRSAGRGGRGGQ